jgi:hypothetical protein
MGLLKPQVVAGKYFKSFKIESTKKNIYFKPYHDDFLVAVL